jgi:hypothetical protein
MSWATVVALALVFTPGRAAARSDQPS